jgi:hypothetical protein
MHTEAPKIQVKCGVDNCQFWHESHCDAPALEVNPMNGRAGSSDDTCCTTFRPGMR